MSKLLTISSFCTATGMFLFLIYQFTQFKPLMAVAGVFHIVALVMASINLYEFIKEKKQENLKKSSPEKSAD